jgi:hypothetical protein
MLAAAFLTLSGGQTVAILAITCAAIVLSYLLGLDEGKVRGRREQREHARKNGSEGLRLVGEDGE